MGATAAKPVRKAPVRYVAKQLPSYDKTPVEQQFKKPSFSAHGINTRRDDVNTEPLMYVETAKDGSGTVVPDHTAPRWYLNTIMEMADNVRVDRTIISGNLPLSWERDKFEPYALVRNRIDDEDLDWVLAPEQRAKGVGALVEHTKLLPGVLQDILDTVELPRVQYRNYKGKLHRAMNDVNTYASERKEQLEHAREGEILRRIGYSDEEMAQDAQYLTQRTRGVRALDELGASQRARTRQMRTMQSSELDEMLQERHLEQLERGESRESLQHADLSRPEQLAITARYHATRTGPGNMLYAANADLDTRKHERFTWWLTRSRRIARAVDKIHGVPRYNDRLTSDEAQMQQQMRDAVEFSHAMGQASGAKGFADPRAHFDEMLGMLRANKEDSAGERGVDVREDDAAAHDIYRFPHIRDHAVQSARAPHTPAAAPMASDMQTLRSNANDNLRELLRPSPPASTTASTDDDNDDCDGNDTQR